MTDPYLGEIRMFSGDFAPEDWAFCDGQLLAITENEDLFRLIGTTYGGDGTTTFALPDLRGRTPMHRGNGHVIGESGVLGFEGVDDEPSSEDLKGHLEMSFIISLSGFY